MTAAQNVVDTAQKALEDAERAYQNAVNEANQLLVGNETDPGLTVQAEELIAAAEAKVKSAQDSLGKAKAEFAAVEADRSGAWDASEAARIAADAAKAAADGQQEVIDTAKNDYGAGIYDKSKEDVDNGADAAISAKELENAAKDVVNAQTNDIPSPAPIQTAGSRRPSPSGPCFLIAAPSGGGCAVCVRPSGGGPFTGLRRSERPPASPCPSRWSGSCHTASPAPAGTAR